MAEMIAKMLKEMKGDNKKYAIREGIMFLMNEYMRGCVNDENLIEPWLMVCIPDDADVDEFEEFAEDNELWHDCLRVFHRDVTRDEKGD